MSVQPLFVGLNELGLIPGPGGVPAWYRDENTGKLVQHELKRYMRPFMLTTDPVTVTVPANGVSDPIPMVIDNKGHFEVLYSMAQATSFNFTLKIMEPGGDGRLRPILMNREIHARTICSGFGTAPLGTSGETFTAADSPGRPFIWPEPLFLNVGKYGRAVFVEFRDLSGSSNVIRFSLHGRRYYHYNATPEVQRKIERLYKQRISMPFFYTTDRDVSLASLASGTFDMRISDDAWFEVWKKAAFSDQTVADQANGASYTVQPVEKNDDRRLICGTLDGLNPDVYVTRGDLYFGDAEFPWLCEEADMYEPNSQLMFRLENLVAATNRIWITYAGRRILVPSPEEVYNMVYR